MNSTENIFSLPTTKKVVRIKTVTELTTRSRASVYSMMDKKSRYWDPDFPLPFKLGERAIGWLLEDIYGYLDLLKKKEGSKSSPNQD